MKKRIFNLSKFLSLLLLVGVIISCEDPEEKREKGFADNYENVNGFYVMCEGLMGQNNSAIDFFCADSNSIITDYFSKANNLGLGETANDMIKVGNTFWTVVTGSAAVTVMNTNGVLEKIITITNAQGVNRQPRHLVHKDGYVYVSCFDGNVVKISTSSKKIAATLSTQGRNPEGLAIANNKLYVANSGGLSYPNYDNSVSVIDLSTFSVDTLISVRINPTTVKSYGDNVYVLSMGDYSGLPMLAHIRNNELVDSVYIKMTDFDIDQSLGLIYYFYVDYADSKSFGLSTLECSNIRSASTLLMKDRPEGMLMPYHVNVVEDGLIAVTDAKNYTTSGEVFFFTSAGEKMFSFKTSVNPNKVIKKRSESLANN